MEADTAAAARTSAERLKWVLHTATQHTAGVTQESRAQITTIAAEAFSDAAAGRMPPRIINPAVKPDFAARYEAARGRRIV